MKNNIYKKFSLSVITFLILIPVAGYSIQVGFYLGNVSVKRNGRKVSINTGSTLKNGDLIRTGKGGTIELLYKDGSKVTILQKSIAKVGSKSIKGSDNVALVSGNVTGKFSKLKKGRHKVYTPTTVCSIRGTEFNIGVAKNGDSRVDLKKGKLDINNPYGKKKMESGDKSDIGIGKKPKKGRGGSMDKWQKKQDKNFNKNPGKSSKQYGKYMKKMNNRSNDTSKDMNGYNKMVKSAKNKKDVENAGDKINTAEENTEDDLLLNETANATVSNIVSDFKNRGGRIYKQFLKVKKESNKVMEQQKRNYEEIQKVKEAYREAYEKIIGKFKDDKKKIWEGMNKDNIKPKFDFNEKK